MAKKVEHTTIRNQKLFCIDLMNPESAEKYIEKGWDEERQLYYYLVYFNKEK